VDIDIPYNASFGLTPDNTMLGEYYNDTVTIGGITLINQSLAVTQAPKIIVEGGLLGIMGLGPRRGSAAYAMPWSPVRGDYEKAPLPVWEHAFEEGVFRPKLFSVWLNDQAAKSGTILFGGVDETKFEGELRTVPLTHSTDEFSEWAVKLTSVGRVDDDTGHTESLTNLTWSIRTSLDTGSPNMYLPAPVCDAIYKTMNVTLHPSPSEPYVSCSLRSARNSLAFGFPGKAGMEGPTIRAPYAEMIYPFGLPTRLGEVRGENGEELCHLGIIPSPGPVYLVGATALRSAYVVYDAERLEVSMAQAKRRSEGTDFQSETD
jgi:hypothetical protein